MESKLLKLFGSRNKLIKTTVVSVEVKI
jgi:hypothetical protein